MEQSICGNHYYLEVNKKLVATMENMDDVFKQNVGDQQLWGSNHSLWKKKEKAYFKNSKDTTMNANK